MARPLSEAKREAILMSAAQLVATEGIGAATARVAKQAGLSEGTLFTYFATKDELLNQLYLALETELSEAILDSYPTGADARERTLHLWERYIDWGVASPPKRKALRQLKISERITADCRRSGDRLFEEIGRRLDQSLADHVAPGGDMDYVRAALGALAEMTMEFIETNKAGHERYKRIGFQILWKGIAG
jgi:AcrR family transcriptional regulator